MMRLYIAGQGDDVFDLDVLVDLVNRCVDRPEFDDVGAGR